MIESATLSDPVLGDLSMRSDPFVMVSLQVSSPAVRAVMRNRALANGMIDDTRFSGARAVTLSLRLNDHRAACTPGTPTMQALYDLLLPYTVPRRRPTLRWSLPGSTLERQLTVRGDSAPMTFDGPKHPMIACQFVAAGGEITSRDQQCVTINASTDVAEPGRTYPLTFPRVYPASLGVGARLVHVGGNEPAHWIGTIFAAVTNPTLMINGISVNFDQLGGVDLTGVQFLVINTRNRTIYLNGDPATPRYDKSNYTAWSWADLLLQPGDNLIRFGGSVIGTNPSVNICWYDTWAG